MQSDIASGVPAVLDAIAANPRILQSPAREEQPNRQSQHEADFAEQLRLTTRHCPLTQHGACR